MGGEGERARWASAGCSCTTGPGPTGTSTSSAPTGGKRVVTFSDAITAVRRHLWQEWVFARTALGQAFEEIPPSLRDLLLNGLAPAA